VVVCGRGTTPPGMVFEINDLSKYMPTQAGEHPTEAFLFPVFS
jgi:hypothetical protein